MSLNTVISNAKRFIAYDIIKRLSDNGEHEILQQLRNSLTQSRNMHSVSFIQTLMLRLLTAGKFLEQKLNYTHLNPARGNYNLIEDWRDYPHSSAGFYEFGNPCYFTPVQYHELA